MARKPPLARRIVIAFSLLTLIVSGLFSLAIVAIVHVVEKDLMGEELGRQMGLALAAYQDEGRVPEFGAGTRLHAPGLTSDHLPPSLVGLPEGFTEIEGNTQAYYAYRRALNGQDFVLVRDQTEFEAREQVLFTAVLLGFLASLALAWGIGRLMVGQVIDPISHLAHRVRHRAQLLPVAPALAPDYADDEVGQLAQAFDAALGQLGCVLERERRFTSDVSHELRTPLMVIATSSELLQSTELSARQRRLVERIDQASEEMRELVQTFILLARAESGNAIAGQESTLRLVAEEQAGRWAPEVRSRGLHFEMQVSADDDGHYNQTFLRVVIGNLLRNALHYTEQGEIRLSLEAGGFRVEDSGIGIADQDKAAVFQPFVRADKTRGDGLGLGLSLVRRICQQEGWTIAVDDRESGGSAFSVRLSG